MNIMVDLYYVIVVIELDVNEIFVIVAAVVENVDYGFD
jgi:hypothetical protein